MANIASDATYRRIRLWQRQRSLLQRCWYWLCHSSWLGGVAARFTPSARRAAARSARMFLDQLPVPAARVPRRVPFAWPTLFPLRLSLRLVAHSTVVGIVALALSWSLIRPNFYSVLPATTTQQQISEQSSDPQVVHQPLPGVMPVQANDMFAVEPAQPVARVHLPIEEAPTIHQDAPTVRDDRTNLRKGPGRAYALVAQLHAGNELQLLARHEQWVQVDGGAAGAGWIRADLLEVPQPIIDALPVNNAIEPPPPRWVWPTHGSFTSAFGWRSEPFRSFHNGIDIANRAGTPIVAASAGTVIQAGWCRGFGYCVYLDHGAGIVSIYGHMLKKPPVAVGDQVDVGDRIGLMGSSYDASGGGYVTGVHLHFTIKVNGKVVNPLSFLP